MSKPAVRSGVNQHGEGATKGPTETWTIAININDTLAWLRYSLNRIAEAFSTGFVLVLRYCCWAMTLNLSVLSNFNAIESKSEIIMFPTKEIDASIVWCSRRESHCVSSWIAAPILMQKDHHWPCGAAIPPSPSQTSMCSSLAAQHTRHSFMPGTALPLSLTVPHSITPAPDPTICPA
jgi:hypothetical protein